jgi:hypothetical protein
LIFSAVTLEAENGRGPPSIADVVRAVFRLGASIHHFGEHAKDAEHIQFLWKPNA